MPRGRWSQPGVKAVTAAGSAQSLTGAHKQLQVVTQPGSTVSMTHWHTFGMGTRLPQAALQANCCHTCVNLGGKGEHEQHGKDM